MYGPGEGAGGCSPPPQKKILGNSEFFGQQEQFEQSQFLQKFPCSFFQRDRYFLFVYVIGLHAVQFGNNWMKKIPRTAKIGRGRRPSPIWLSKLELFNDKLFSLYIRNVFCLQLGLFTSQRECIIVNAIRNNTLRCSCGRSRGIPRVWSNPLNQKS